MGRGRRLISRSAPIIAMRLGGAALVFALHVAVARTWGAGPLGEFLLVVALVNLLAMAMPLGFQTVASYFAADYAAGGRRKALVSFLWRAYGHIAVVGAVLLTGALALGPLLPPDLVEVRQLWAPTLLMAVAMAVVLVNAGALVGLKRAPTGLAADGLLRPILIWVGFAVALAAAPAGEGLATLLWISAAGFAAVAAGHLMHLVIVVRRLDDGDAELGSEPARWRRFAWPWMVLTVATEYLFDLDLLHLSALMPAEELAVFGVVARMFGLAAFGLSAIYAVSLPHVFDSAAAQDHDGSLRRIGDANFAAVFVSVLMLVGSVLAGPALPLIFAPEFAAGGPALAVLCLGLVVRAAFGPAALVLSMNDRPRAALPAVGVGVATMVAGNLLLVPAWGITGAAVAACAAMTVWSAAMWATARFVAQVDVSIWPRLRSMLQPAVPGLDLVGPRLPRRSGLLPPEQPAEL